MRGNLKKWIIMGLCILSLGSMSAYAEEVDEKPVLTLEKAIESAYGRSSALSLNVQQTKVLEEKVERAWNQNSSYVAYQQLYIQKNQNDREYSYIKDQIAQDVTTRYQNIINCENELKNLEKEIEVQTKALAQLKLQKEKGLISKVQYESAELELVNLQTTLRTKTETLRTDKSYFKDLTGKTLEDYTLDVTIDYMPFRIEGSVEGYCDKLATDYFKYNQELAELSKNNIIIDGMPGIEYADYLNSKYNAEKSLQAVADGIKSMKQSLMTSYSNLLNLEEQIGSLQYQIDFLKTQLHMLEAQCKAGIKTPLEYEKQTLNLDKLEQNLRSLITNYNKLQNMVEKPWVSMSIGR